MQAGVAFATMSSSVGRARLYLLGRLAAVPSSHPLKRIARALRLNRWVPWISNKYYSELGWQNRWAPVFQANVEKVRQYWREYRYFDEILRIVQPGDDTRILDVGCGISTVLHFLPGRRFGIDPLAEEYKRIYRYPSGIEVRRGFGEAIPFPDGYFDVVFCSNVLDHTTDPPRVVKEIDRVIRAAGYLVLTVEIFPSVRERDLSHPHAFTREQVRALLDGSFETVFAKQSPWIMLLHYVDGSMKREGEQLVLVGRKKS